MIARNKWLLFFLCLFLIGLAIFIIFSCAKKEKNSFLNKDLLRYKYKKVKRKDYYCPLCGVKVKEEVKKRVLCIKIENSPSARPQSGLDKACLVYEFLTEGGITRFNAFYLCREVNNVGPVRSARFPDLILLKQYNALFAHCGGSAPVLVSLRSQKSYLDLDQMRYESAYWRLRSRRRPHNLYTSTYKLRELARKLGYEKEEPFPSPFTFKEEAPLTTPSVTYINIPYSPWSNTSFIYDSKGNQYLRYIGKRPHLDAESGRQLAAKNLVIFFTSMRTTEFRDSRGSKVADFKLTGEGEAWFFIDGSFIKGSWKSDEENPPHFFDQEGKEIKFNRGPIWIEVVPPRIKPVLK